MQSITINIMESGECFNCESKKCRNAGKNLEKPAVECPEFDPVSREEIEIYLAHLEYLKDHKTLDKVIRKLKNQLKEMD